MSLCRLFATLVSGSVVAVVAVVVIVAVIVVVVGNVAVIAIATIVDVVGAAVVIVPPWLSLRLLLLGSSSSSLSTHDFQLGRLISAQLLDVSLNYSRVHYLLEIAALIGQVEFIA
jgi:hypothetical protein